MNITSVNSDCLGRVSPTRRPRKPAYKGRPVVTHSQGASDWPSVCPACQQSISSPISDPGPSAPPLNKTLGRIRGARTMAAQANWKGEHGHGSQEAWTPWSKWCGEWALRADRRKCWGKGGGTVGTERKKGKTAGLGPLSPSTGPWETSQRKQEGKYFSFDFSKASILRKRE